MCRTHNLIICASHNDKPHLHVDHEHGKLSFNFFIDFVLIRVKCMGVKNGLSTTVE